MLKHQSAVLLLLSWAETNTHVHTKWKGNKPKFNYPTSVCFSLQRSNEWYSRHCSTVWKPPRFFKSQKCVAKMLPCVCLQWCPSSRGCCIGQPQFSSRLWCLNAQLILREPKCAKKIFPTTLHHSLNRSYRSGWVPPRRHSCLAIGHLDTMWLIMWISPNKSLWLCQPTS